MKIKTATAIGKVLNFMVAKATGMCVLNSNGTVFWGNFATVTPATSWAQGGPIIERERMTITYNGNDDAWEAYISDRGMSDDYERGPTPLIAAMRCFVASCQGDTVEIPDDLC